jgi:hypothetical protein
MWIKMPTVYVFQIVYVFHINDSMVFNNLNGFNGNIFWKEYTRHGSENFWLLYRQRSWILNLFFHTIYCNIVIEFVNGNYQYTVLLIIIEIAFSIHGSLIFSCVKKQHHFKYFFVL